MELHLFLLPIIHLSNIQALLSYRHKMLELWCPYISFTAPNKCDNNNGNCSHLCLLSVTDPRGFTCACPEGMSLEANMLSCIGKSAWIIYSYIALKYMKWYRVIKKWFVSEEQLKLHKYLTFECWSWISSLVCGISMTVEECKVKLPALDIFLTRIASVVLYKDLIFHAYYVWLI